MALKPPPIQERVTTTDHYVRQTWTRWFTAITREMNAISGGAANLKSDFSTDQYRLHERI